MWKKTVIWNSKLTETIILTDAGDTLLFEARSTCSHDSRIVAYTWSHKDSSAEGISCHKIPMKLSVRTWSEVLYPLPQGSGTHGSTLAKY